MAEQVSGVWGEPVDAAEPKLEETPVVEAVIEPAKEEVPAPVAEPIAEPVVETVITEMAATPEVKEVIKEVEKIVEKYPEMDEYTKEVFEALMEGKEDVLFDYLSEKHKNYGTMSDFDVVKSNLQKQNPKWSGADIDLEMRSKYGKQLEKIDISDIDKDINPDEYKDALRHNEKVEENEVLLRRDARDARIALDEAKKNIALPKIKKEEAVVNEGPTPEQIEQFKKEYLQEVDSKIPEVSEFKFKVGDMDVAYKVTDDERKEMADLLKSETPQAVAKALGWWDENGKQNVAKIAGDVLKLQKLEKIIASAVTQAKTNAKKEVISEDIKNIDLSNTRNDSVASTPPELAQLLWQF